MEDSNMDEQMVPDAAMMENSIDANLGTNIDDLFGEAADELAADGLGMALPLPPLPPKLVSRIDDMQTQGCCTKLAWANTGTIAQIKDGGGKIVLRSLLRNQRDGTWALTEPSKQPISPPDGAKWVHLQFSKFSNAWNPGNDLAAADSLGRVSIYTCIGVTPLGKMLLAHHDIAPNESPRQELDAVVGLYWIPAFTSHVPELKLPNLSHVTKMDGRWSATFRTRDPNEPILYHPAESQQALFHVSRDNKLTLMYQFHNVWNAIDTKLGNVSSSAELVSHAAMCEEADHVLLVTHDLSRRLRLYRININWNATQAARSGTQTSITALAPVLDVMHLTTLDNAIPQHGDMAKLSSLHMVAATPPSRSSPDVPSLPTVLAVFTRASLSTDMTQQNQEAYSVISRWHVESNAPTLHEAFNKLKKPGTNAPLQITTTSLSRQEDVFTGNLVLSLGTQRFNTILAFAASDGTIDFRDRSNMSSIEPYPDSTNVSSLSQSGFEHTMDKSGIDVAMSGDGSSLAILQADGQVNHKMMTLRYTWHPIMDDGSLVEAAVVCLARQYTVSCVINASNDEILALLPLNLGLDMRTLFVKETMKMMRRDPLLDLIMHDQQRQQHATLRENVLPKAVSAQLALGRNPGTMDPTFAGKYAFAFLNMRLVAITLPPLFNNPQNFTHAHVLLSLRGLMKWGSDCLAYVADSIIAAKRMLESASNEPVSDVCARFIAEKINPVVHILLCTYSRTYLRFLFAGIPKYLNAVQKSMALTRPGSDRQQLLEVYETGTSLPFKYSDFEAFISDIDIAMRNAYTRGAVTAGRRIEIELSLLTCDLPIPSELHSALEEVFNTAVPKFMDKVDLAKLYFWDTAWLGIESGGRQQEYDIARKLPLLPGMKLKVCRRCGAAREDLGPERMRDLVLAPGPTSRSCVCLGFWDLD